MSHPFQTASDVRKNEGIDPVSCDECGAVWDGYFEHGAGCSMRSDNTIGRRLPNLQSVVDLDAERPSEGIEKLGRVRDDITEHAAKACLAELQRRFQEQAKPYFDALVRLDMMQPPAPIVVDPSAPLDTSKLGRIAYDPGVDATNIRIVREALKATGDHNMKIASGLSSDEACLHLRRLLK